MLPYYRGDNMANINVRIDEKLKRKAEAVFDKIGLTPSAAINLFYVQVVRTNSIPFDLKADIPNKTTAKALKEVDEMEKNNTGRTYTSVDAFVEDLTK